MWILFPEIEQQDPEQQNKTPATKSGGFFDTAPSNKSKKPAPMTSIVAIMGAVAPRLSGKVSVSVLVTWSANPPRPFASTFLKTGAPAYAALSVTELPAPNREKA